MQFLSDLFHIVLYQPLFNILILFYQYLPGKDLGIAIISLTLLIKILLYPLGVKATILQKSLNELQPKIKEIQEKYKGDRQKQTLEILALYKKENINPFAGIFISLIQVPILIALFLVFWGGLQSEKLNNLYSFVPSPGLINPLFLGILNLTQPSPLFAVLAGIGQFLQTKMLTPSLQTRAGQTHQKTTPDFSQIMQKQILYLFPFFTVVVLLKLPSAVGLYWLTTSIFSIAQQYFILKNQNKTKNYPLYNSVRNNP